MFDWIGNVLGKLAQYAIDFLVWLLEFVFWIFDALIRFLWELARPVVDACLDAVASKLPTGLIDAIVAAYAWFQYVNEWIPIKYGITLFLAYYALASALYIFRVFLSFFPLGRV